MENLQKHLFSITALVGLFVSVHAPGQVCQVEQVQRLDSPQQALSTGFGFALDISGEILVVGDWTDDAIATDMGAAHIFERRGDSWDLVQTLRPSEGSADDRFGSSVAVQNGVVLVGSPRNSFHGAVYGFEFVNGEWTQAVKLFDDSVNDAPEFPGEQNFERRFGSAVAIDGTTLLVGAPMDSSGAALGGAVYQFEWPDIQVTKWIPSNPGQVDQFGFSVTLDGENALIAAPGKSPGTTYAFWKVADGWREIQQIPLPSGYWYDYAPAPICLDGRFACLGSPNGNGSGRAFAYELRGAQWMLTGELNAPDSKPGDQFGTGVAIHGSSLFVGAPGADVIPPLQPTELTREAGGVYMFELASGEPQFLRKHIAEFECNDQGNINEFNGLGIGVAADGECLAVASPAQIGVDDEIPLSAVYIFQTAPPDCDDDGTPDFCDADCNHNRIADSCEFLAGALEDCDADGQSDACQNDAHYLLGESGQAIAFGADNIDFVWLTQFTVTAGHQRITHILVPWVYWMPDDYPATVMLYDDPDNDGDPQDAKLLVSVNVTGFDDFGLDLPLEYTVYEIPTTHVGEINDSFFVGAYVQCLPNVRPAVGRNQFGAEDRSWHVGAAYGSVQIEQLSRYDIQHSNYNYMLRALALDCNGNGEWDQCDIDSGVALDSNANGIPDECEGSCIADIAPPQKGNGTVDVDDLLTVINGWGSCPKLPETCPADLNVDGIVDVDDLLTIINNWGPCT